MKLVPIAPAQPPQQAPNRAFRFSDEQTRAVIAAYEAGESMASLARQFDVRREAISKLLQRSGVTIRKQRVMTQAEISEAAQLYQTGLSLQRIADRIGWEDTKIYNQLKKLGVQFRSAHR